MQPDIYRAYLFQAKTKQHATNIITHFSLHFKNNSYINNYNTNTFQMANNLNKHLISLETNKNNSFAKKVIIINGKNKLVKSSDNSSIKKMLLPNRKTKPQTQNVSPRSKNNLTIKKSNKNNNDNNLIKIYPKTKKHRTVIKSDNYFISNTENLDNRAETHQNKLPKPFINKIITDESNLSKTIVDDTDSQNTFNQSTLKNTIMHDNKKKLNSKLNKINTINAPNKIKHEKEITKVQKKNYKINDKKESAHIINKNINTFKNKENNEEEKEKTIECDKAGDYKNYRINEYEIEMLDCFQEILNKRKKNNYTKNYSKCIKVKNNNINNNNIKKSSMKFCLSCEKERINILDKKNNDLKNNFPNLKNNKENINNINGFNKTNNFKNKKAINLDENRYSNRYTITEKERESNTETLKITSNDNSSIKNRNKKNFEKVFSNKNNFSHYNNYTNHSFFPSSDEIYKNKNNNNKNNCNSFNNQTTHNSSMMHNYDNNNNNNYIHNVSILKQTYKYSRNTNNRKIQSAKKNKQDNSKMRYIKKLNDTLNHSLPKYVTTSSTKYQKNSYESTIRRISLNPALNNQSIFLNILSKNNEKTMYKYSSQKEQQFKKISYNIKLPEQRTNLKQKYIFAKKTNSPPSYSNTTYITIENNSSESNNKKQLFSPTQILRKKQFHSTSKSYKKPLNDNIIESNKKIIKTQKQNNYNINTQKISIIKNKTCDEKYVYKNKLHNINCNKFLDKIIINKVNISKNNKKEFEIIKIPTVADENAQIFSLKIMKYNKGPYTNQVISQKMNEIFSIDKVVETILSYLSEKNIFYLSIVNSFYYKSMIKIIYKIILRKLIQYKNLNNTSKIIEKIWKKKDLLNISNNNIINKISTNKNLNEILLNLSKKYDSDIIKDLSRTFPNENNFINDSANMDKLFNVLKIYSNNNSKIGYAQGMNFIVAKLLLFFQNEKDTFIYLDALFNKLNMEHVIGINNDLKTKMNIIQFLLNKYCLDVVKYLENKKINHEIFTAGWIITLFSKNFKENGILMNIWNFAIIFGWKFIYLFIISVILVYKSKFMNLELYGFTQFMKDIFITNNFKEKFDEIIQITFDFMSQWKNTYNDIQNYLNELNKNNININPKINDDEV